MPSGEVSRWERGSERTLVSTKVLDLKSVHFRHPVRGMEREFTIIHTPDWVNVLAVTPADHLVLVLAFFVFTDAWLRADGG